MPQWVAALPLVSSLSRCPSMYTCALLWHHFAMASLPMMASPSHLITMHVGLHRLGAIDSLLLRSFGTGICSRRLASRGAVSLAASRCSVATSVASAIGCRCGIRFLCCLLAVRGRLTSAALVVFLRPLLLFALEGSKERS
jgi:hypothetical protein